MTTGSLSLIEHALRAVVAGAPLPGFRSEDAQALLGAIDVASRDGPELQRVGLMALQLLVAASLASAEVERATSVALARRRHS